MHGSKLRHEYLKQFDKAALSSIVVIAASIARVGKKEAARQVGATIE